MKRGGLTTSSLRPARAGGRSTRWIPPGECLSMAGSWPSWRTGCRADCGMIAIRREFQFVEGVEGALGPRFRAMKHSRQPRPAGTNFRRWTISVLALGATSVPTTAQELEPRAYANSPVGLNFAIAGYAFTDGTLSVDPSIPLEDAVRQGSGRVSMPSTTPGGGRPSTAKARKGSRMRARASRYRCPSTCTTRSSSMAAPISIRGQTARS